MPTASLEHLRARRAYATLRDHPELAEWTERLPAMLQTNGLLATWAHLLSKPNDHAAGLLLGAVSEHLWSFESRQGNPRPPRTLFVDWVSEGSNRLTPERMMRLTAEALALAAWLKRAGQAVGGVD